MNKRNSLLLFLICFCGCTSHDYVDGTAVETRMVAYRQIDEAIYSDEKTRLYEYLRVLEVIDGDTVDVEIDLGLDIFTRQRIRLYGINAPEKNTIEGTAAKARLASLFKNAKKIRMWTTKTRQNTDRKEKYGRYLGQFEIVTEDSTIAVNSKMIDEGHAKPYFGGRKED